MGFPGDVVVKRQRSGTANAGDAGDAGAREDPGRRKWQSCLENPMDRGAWQAIVHGCKELDTTEQQSAHVHTHTHLHTHTHIGLRAHSGPLRILLW